MESWYDYTYYTYIYRPSTLIHTFSYIHTHTYVNLRAIVHDDFQQNGSIGGSSVQARRLVNSTPRRSKRQIATEQEKAGGINGDE